MGVPLTVTVTVVSAVVVVEPIVTPTARTRLRAPALTVCVQDVLVPVVAPVVPAGPPLESIAMVCLSSVWWTPARYH